MNKLVIALFLLSISSGSQAGKKDKSKFYKKVFSSFDKLETIAIADPISDEPVNLELIKVYHNKKLIGFVREISTTTGCNSACLPVIYTAFFKADGSFLKVLSRDGLTKIGHAPFTEEDYSKLEFLLVMAPMEFNSVKHPKEMTDAISGATTKKFKEIVVPGAAYSTLRIHLYNQQTQKFIKSLVK